MSQEPEALGGSASPSAVEEVGLGWDDDETLKAAHNPPSSA